MTISANGALTVAGNGLVNNMPACTVTNYGSVVWVSGTIQGGNGAAIYNYGLWDARSDQNFTDAFGGVTTFNNLGAFRKSVGTATNFTIFAGGVAFNQLAGVLDVQQGSLVLQYAGSFSGGYVTTNSTGITYLNAGSFTINGAVTSSNTWQYGGNLVGNNVLNGALTWVSGNWNSASSVTIASNAVLFVAGGTGANDMAGTVVTNNGTVAWVSGSIRGGNTLIYNYGLWDAQSDQNLTDFYGGSGVVFNNFGAFRKSAGASAGYTIFQGGVTFNQAGGVLDVQNWNLGLNGGGSFTGGYVTTNTTGKTFLDLANFTINGSVMSSNVVQISGNLAGVNVIQGALTWIGGSWTNATVTIASNGMVIMAGAASANSMPACTLTNYGTVAWSSGAIQGGNGTTVYNYGLWDAQCDANFNNAFGGVNTAFNNFGTFRKSVGAATNFTIFVGGAAFNQSAGVLDVQNGKFVLQSASSFTGGYVTTNSTGATYLNAGGFTINGTVTSSNVYEFGGGLVGANVLNGSLTWVSGNWNTASSVTIAPNAVLIVAGAAGSVDMAGTVVTNNGTVAWASGLIRGGNGTTIYNYGLWDAQSDQSFNDAYGGGTTFNNFGTFRKSGGASEYDTATFFLIGVAFNQLAGMIDVQNGTNGLELALTGGGNFTGGYITTNQFGLTYLISSNYNINGTVTGTNTWQANLGSLVGTNVINGALTWVSGNWNNTVVTLASNSQLIINNHNNQGNHHISNCIFTNNGTVTWSQDALSAGNGTVIYNNGLWIAQDDQILNNFSGGAGTVFNNLGAFRKTGSSGGSTRFQSPAYFNNLGTLDSQLGSISLEGPYSLTNGTLNFGINSLTSYGTIVLFGTAALTGTFSASLNNGFQPVSGNSFTNLYYSSYTGGFTGASLPSVPYTQTWITNYRPGFFVFSLAGSFPVFTAPATNLFVVNELATLAVTNTATEPASPPQILTYSLASGVNGIALDPVTGVLTWTPQQTNSPSTNTITVTVTDNGTPPLSATNTYTVIVKEVNVPPSLPSIPTQTVNELALLSVTNTATNANIHSTVTGYALVNPPSGMSIDLNGIITWTPQQTNSPSTNTITAIATNSNPYDVLNPSLTSTNQFTVIVNEVNIAPTLPTIPPQTVNELTLLSVTNTATNANIHSTITGYALVSPPSGMSIDINGIITWTPQQTNSPSTNTITAIATNSNPYDVLNPSLTSTNQFTVIVNEVNIAPSLPTILTQAVNELTLLSVTNTATNANIHSTITGYALVSPPSGMSIDINGIITWTPQQTNSPSTNTITAIATNSNPYDVLNPSLTSTNQFTVIVNEVNIAPTLPTIPIQTVNELTLLTVTNTATNANIHSTITGYALVSPPSGMSIDINGIITWTPQQTNSPSTNTITAIATNSNPYDVLNPSLTSTNQFTVIVNEVNVAPTLPTISTQTITLLQPFSITNTATETNIHSVTAGYLLLVSPAGAAIDTNGVITWTAQNQPFASNLFTTVVSNSNPYDLVNPQLSSTNSFSVLVTPSTAAAGITLLQPGGNNLTLSWPPDHTGWRLEVQTNSLGSNWTTWPGSSATNQVIIPIQQTNAAMYFLLVYP